ncbi:hypothetical protein [Pseudomonas protegens]|uniref:hypothetical protein n=1 Tax=Pseudomonas protegens TaxID=380021 RepID=UPI0013C3482E|nr:hypothetical protein [Pseudomonas protegens]
MTPLNFYALCLLTSSMILGIPNSHASACTQSEMDEISKASKSMKEVLFNHSICTSIGANSQRSQCWLNNPLTTEEHQAYIEVENKYASFLASCEWDSIKYNLGNFRQAFGFECEAFDAFVSIKDSPRYKDLDRIKAESALQCASNSQRSELFDKKRALLGEFIKGAVKRSSESSNRKTTGRLLSVWRDYFVLGSSTKDSLSVANSIHSSDSEWENWKLFLEPLRMQLASWRNSLFPDRHNIKTTAKQYEISVSKLTN